MKRIAFILAMFLAFGVAQPASSVEIAPQAAGLLSHGLVQVKCGYDQNDKQGSCQYECKVKGSSCRERFAAINDNCDAKQAECEKACGCEPGK